MYVERVQDEKIEKKGAGNFAKIQIEKKNLNFEKKNVNFEKKNLNFEKKKTGASWIFYVTKMPICFYKFCRNNSREHHHEEGALYLHLMKRLRLQSLMVKQWEEVLAEKQK